MAQPGPAGKRRAGRAGEALNLGRSARRARASATTLAAILLLLIALTLATSRHGDARLYPPPAGAGVTLFVVDNGFHSDLAIPRAVLIAHGGPAGRATALASTEPWVLVGWGDEGFYEGEGFSAARIVDGLAALAGLHRRTVVHLEGHPASPDRTWRDGVHRIAVSTAGLDALLARLDQSFALDAGGGPIRLLFRRTPGEMFFAGRGHFSALHLCNHQTAALLAAAGLPTTPVLDTLPAGLVLDLKLRART